MKNKRNVFGQGLFAKGAVAVAVAAIDPETPLGKLCIAGHKQLPRSVVRDVIEKACGKRPSDRQCNQIALAAIGCTTQRERRGQRGPHEPTQSRAYRMVYAKAIKVMSECLAECALPSPTRERLCRIAEAMRAMQGGQSIESCIDLLDRAEDGGSDDMDPQPA